MARNEIVEKENKDLRQEVATNCPQIISLKAHSIEKKSLGGNNSNSLQHKATPVIKERLVRVPPPPPRPAS